MKRFIPLGFVAALLFIPPSSSQTMLGGGGGGITPSGPCGDATHALGWSGTVYNCQAITATAAAGGSTTQLQYNNATALGGIAGAVTDGTIVTFTNSDIKLLGSSTGATTFTSDNAGASNFTLHFPAANDTLADIAGIQTLTNKTIAYASNTLTGVAPTANPTFTGSLTATGLVTNADLVNASVTVAGKSVALGASATVACADLSNGATGCSTATGTSGATIPLLNAANTWSAQQIFNNSDIALLGSSTGKTTFTSANAGASNFTLTLPAITDTLALAGIGSVISSNGTTTSPTAAQFNNNCPIYTLNATTAVFNIPSAATLQANGGCMWISNPSTNTYTLTPNGSDNLTGPGHPVANSSMTLVPGGSLVLVTTDGTADFASETISNLSTNIWKAPQSCLPVALTISTTTFTPNGTSCNYEVTLTGNDTLANPSPAFAAGQDGTFKICQDGSGSHTITYGSVYWAAGGVSTLPLTATASKCDIVAYHTDLALNVWLIPSSANGSH